MKSKRLISAALATAVMGAMLTVPVSAAKQTITVDKDTYVDSWVSNRTKAWGHLDVITLKNCALNNQFSGQYNGGDSNNYDLNDRLKDFKSGYLGFNLSGLEYKEDAKYELTLQLQRVDRDNTTIYAVRATDKIYTIVNNQAPSDITKTDDTWLDNATAAEPYNTINNNGWKATTYPRFNCAGYVSYLSKPMFIANKGDDADPKNLAYCARDAANGSTFRFANYAVATGVASAGAESVTLDITNYVNEKLQDNATEITIGIFANDYAEVYQKEYDNGSKAATLTATYSADWAYTFKDKIENLSEKSFYISTNQDDYNVPLTDVITVDSLQGDGSAGIALVIKDVPDDVTIDSVTVK